MGHIPPLRITFLHEDIEEILRRIRKSLGAGQVAQGENVREFEEAFARFVGVRHAVAVSSGGSAIEVAMRIFGVMGQEVLVPTNTFVATASGVLLAGGRVRFVDANRDTFSVSLKGLQAAVTPKAKGVIVVHIGGIITPEIEEIRDWCASKGLWLFEDAAHAHGSGFRGVMAGRFGRMAAYSFFATKVMTSGEGGMLVTDDEALANQARGLRDYGKPDPWVSFHTALGSNWRMSEFCAAVGLIHLRRLPEMLSARATIASFYTEKLKALPELKPILPVGESSWYKYIVLLPAQLDRNRVKARMKAKGVTLAGGVYETPLHRQPVFQGVLDDFPVAEEICARHICLPIYYGMTHEEANDVVEALKSVLAEERIGV